MSTPDETPAYSTILAERRARLLVLTLNRPEAMNAANRALHDDLAAALAFARDDAGSDVVLLTGAGRAFCAGGDIDHISRSAANPELFDHEVRMARAIVFTLLDIDKPLVCRMNGHAIGLGATLALLCDVIFAADTAKIGDPHVGLGLVAGDGGVLAWAHRIGLARAKEFLFTGEALKAPQAAAMGLVNHALPPGELDAAVDVCCARLLAQPAAALRATKLVCNIELKRQALAVIDAGIALEALSVRSGEHLAAVAALRIKLGKVD